MVTARQRQSYRKLQKNGIARYRGNTRKRDELILVLGPIGKFVPLDRKSGLDWIGMHGMYLVVSYRKSRGQWVYGKYFHNIWRPSADKLLREAKRNAKSAYYCKEGTLSNIGKIVRKDSEIRPAR
tara:strand:- start:4001 stop:4375 length:375 start_codon:yes stop_codon:yes gene_type:complete